MKKISSMRPAERLQHVLDIVANDGELNADGGTPLALSVPAVVTYEAVRGISAPDTMRCRVVGMAYDVSKLQHQLVVLDIEAAQLRTVPLTTLVSIERELV